MKRIAFWLYQVYAWFLLIPFGLLFTLVCGWVAVVVASIKGPTFASRYVARNWARVLCWLTPVRVTVEGAENADPGGTYVVVCNHQSQYDIFLAYGWLNLDLKWVLKAELRKAPGLGIGCEKVGHIFVDRKNPEQARKAVRDALGYPQLNLYGVSYGSRVAQHFAKRYPDAVRSVVLDGVVPPQLTLGPEIAIEAQKALDNIFTRCAADTACAERFPNLQQSFAKLRSELGEQAVVVDLSNPVSGKREYVDFGSNELAGALRLGQRCRTVGLSFRRRCQRRRQAEHHP